MRGGGGIDRRVAGPVAALATLLVAGTGPIAAAEPGAQSLPGTSPATAVLDLDGDGSDEIVRLTFGVLGDLVIDAWRFDGDAWALVDERPVPVPVADGDDGVPDSGPPAPSALLRWQDGGVDRLLYVSALQDANSQFGELCCATVWRILIDDGLLAFAPMELEGSSFEGVATVDLDSDGTDELVTLRTTFADSDDPGTTVLQVLAWEGNRWTTRFHDAQAAYGNSFVAGESDRHPGADIIIGPVDGEITRISQRNGEVVTERRALEGLGGREAWMAAIADGRIVVAVSDGVHLLRWPADAPAVVEASARTSSFPTVQVAGAGTAALLIVQSPDASTGAPQPRVDVHDLSLERLGSVAFDDAVQVAWRRIVVGGALWTESGRPLFPYIGPVPGMDGFAAGGTLIESDGTGGYATTPMAGLIGVSIVGVARADGDWAVIGGYGVPGAFGGLNGRIAYLHGGLRREGSPPTTVMPVGDLFLAPPDVTGTLELRDAVALSADRERIEVAADGDGFTLRVGGPRGTVAAMLEPATRVYERGHRPIEITIRPPRGGEEDQPLARTLLVVSPTGHASLIRLEGTFIRQPPELTVTAETRSLEARSAVRGRASAGAVVTVDGEPVETTTRGGFEAVVDAPLWPRSVIVTATDPLGNETTRRIDVVGVLDYRGWPWLAITVALTLGLGAAMVLRTPARRSSATIASDDASLEEIELPE